MKYENAKRGVGMIYTGEILQLIAFVLTVVASVFDENGSAVSLIFALAALVLVIIGTIKQVKGIITARPDEKRYQYALVTIIVWFVAELLVQILPMVIPSMKPVDVHAVGASLLNILVLLTVVQATNALLKTKENAELVKKGNIVIALNIAAFWVENLLDSMVDIAEEKAVLTFTIAIVFLVVSIVAYFKYLAYLKKAAEAL